MPSVKTTNPYTESEMVDFLWKSSTLSDGENLLIPVPDKNCQKQVLQDMFKQLSVMSTIAPEVARNIFITPYFHANRLWIKIRRRPSPQTYFIVSEGEVKKLKTTESND